jgi:thiol-disulfide isomerase/thioredoxin
MKLSVNTRTTRLRGGVVGLLAFACIQLSTSVALGQYASGVLADFEPADFVLEIEGALVASAEVYQSRSAGAILILSPDLSSPVLLRLRTAEVETIDLMKVNRRLNGLIDLLPEPTIAPQGKFQVSKDGNGVSFLVDGRRAALKEKPPLLGDQDVAGLAAYSADYRKGAEAYSGSAPIIQKLRGETRPVTVKVYFGSWCGFCKQMVPRIMNVAQQLEGSKINIDFYGLPHDIHEDAQAAALEINAVPTGVVYIDGKEVDRISGNGWKIPELAINNALTKAGSS